MKSIVKRPLVTENSLLAAKSGWYTFVVSRQARKPEIAQEVEKLYKVEVVDVQTNIMAGKTRRRGRRQTLVVEPQWKKARVRLKKGQNIAEFEEVTQEEKK